MEPNIKTAFEQILRRLDSIDERCGHMEKGAAGSKRACEEWDTEVEIHVDQLEKAVGTQATSSSTAVVQIQAQEECTAALDTRLTSLEKIYNTRCSLRHPCSEFRADDHGGKAADGRP
jgi:hypothetical protein